MADLRSGLSPKIKRPLGILRAVLLCGCLLGQRPCLAAIGLEVATVDGGSTIDFGVINDQMPGTEFAAGSITKEVRLTVTDTGNQRYVVSQMVHAPPTDGGGHLFDSAKISCYAAFRQGSGDLRIAHATPLFIGEQEIFYSSASGGTSEIILVYRIDAPQNNPAGVYNTLITYKVSTL